MKNIFILLIIVCSTALNAQTNFTIYYDASGNRIKQGIECLLTPPEPLVSRLEVYPNPANTNALLSFRIEQAGQLGIMLLTTTNVKVKDIYSGMAAVDNYQFNIDIGNLPSAVYFIRLQLADRVQSYRLVVIH